MKTSAGHEAQNAEWVVSPGSARAARAGRHAERLPSARALVRAAAAAREDVVRPGAGDGGERVAVDGLEGPAPVLLEVDDVAALARARRVEVAARGAPERRVARRE